MIWLRSSAANSASSSSWSVTCTPSVAFKTFPVVKYLMSWFVSGSANTKTWLKIVGLDQTGELSQASKAKSDLKASYLVRGMHCQEWVFKRVKMFLKVESAYSRIKSQFLKSSNVNPRPDKIYLIRFKLWSEKGPGLQVWRRKIEPNEEYSSTSRHSDKSDWRTLSQLLNTNQTKTKANVCTLCLLANGPKNETATRSIAKFKTTKGWCAGCNT